MEGSAASFLGELQALRDEQVDLVSRYKQLYELLRRVCVAETADGHVEYSGLFSRLYAVCRHRQIDYHAVDRVRRNARRVLSGEVPPDAETFRSDWASLCRWLSCLYAFDLPAGWAETLNAIENPVTLTGKTVTLTDERHRRLRLTVLETDETGFTAVASQGPSDETFRVECAADETVLRQLRGAMQVNVLDYVRRGQSLFPDMVVIEPDFLLDVSRLSACVKPYGSHPLNYLLDQFAPRAVTRSILLGEAANGFMDDCVNSRTAVPAPEAYQRAMRKHFREHLLEYATLADPVGRDYFDTAYMHFLHIRKVIGENFSVPDNMLSPDDLVLEPSFICEAMGLRGRLDVMNINRRSVVELKSGRADDYGHAPRPQAAHALQMGLYKAILHYNFGLPYHDIRTFLLYSRYPLLYDERSSHDAIKGIMRLRNAVVSLEREVRRHGVTRILDRITVETLNERKLGGRFFETYLRPPIERMCRTLQDRARVTDRECGLAARYFNTFLAFLKREHYLSKLGDNRPDSTRGFARVWTAGARDKQLTGDLLSGLFLREVAGDEGIERLVFSLPDYGPDFLPDFSEGEMVQLYECDGPHDNVTNHQLFRGYIEELSDERLVVRLTYKQRNVKVLPLNRSYAVEHDSSDAVFTQAYRGIYQFLTAPAARQRLLLGLRLPERDEAVRLSGRYPNADIEAIVLAAKQARDCYLLVGPPGTGKTSVALRAMVEEFLCEVRLSPGRSLLLTAYTNRAVDEICQMLDTLVPAVDYVRIGVEQTCALAYRPHLLSQWAARFTRSEEVTQALRLVPVVVGTVATMSGHQELLAFKRFDAVIIDEASQILEPQLLPLLAASADGQPLIGKFIMIGDHKQLPAVVMQSERDTRVTDEHLLRVGLTDLGNSLFERLYGLYRRAGRSDCYGWLDRQGRMHPAICRYVNHLFYGDRLRSVPLPHQLGDLPFRQKGEGLSRLIAHVRVGFLPVRLSRPSGNHKANMAEAEAVASLVAAIGHLYELNGLPFDVARQVGVIVPFRNQIALVRRCLAQRGVACADRITVDTVECYQGSQRDHIIFSTTISKPYQLGLLSAVQYVDGRPVDRKLNVAVTRARMQLLVVGDDRLLCRNPLYRELIASSVVLPEHIQESNSPIT